MQQLVTALVALTVCLTVGGAVTTTPVLNMITTSGTPSQLHLYYGRSNSERWVSWVTSFGWGVYDPPLGSECLVGTVKGKWTSTFNGTTSAIVMYDRVSHAGPNRTATLHSVHLTGLQPGVTYFYQCGCNDQRLKAHDESSWSDVFSFRVTPELEDTFAVYGDFGIENDKALGMMLEDLDAHKFTGVVHVGDFAYNLDYDNGTVGDRFLSSIEPISATVPYMVMPGNHEGNRNFTEYLSRFHTASLAHAEQSGSGTHLWYSYDRGLVHFVHIDTEVFSEYEDPGQQQRQFNWLREDLARANLPENRKARPWLIVCGHRPRYMAHALWAEGLSSIFYEYGVDLYLTGHQHNYQRHFPWTFEEDGYHIFEPGNPNVYDNPPYHTTILVGSPGCIEGISHATDDPSVLAYRAFEYGYGMLRVANSTHLYWSWSATMDATGLHSSPRRGVAQDNLLLIQDVHGPR